MQNYPGYNPNAPGAPPMQHGFQQPGFRPHPNMGPQRPPNQAGPCFSMGPMQGPPPPQPGCFMPAATIRKISNTTPPAQFFNPQQ